ncbi:hypothetical protein BHM03_00044090, partial [Ensete ventricosum]
MSLHRFWKNQKLATLVVIFLEELHNAWQLDCYNRSSDILPPLLFLDRSYQHKQCTAKIDALPRQPRPHNGTPFIGFTNLIPRSFPVI